jgi:hypothetical protein
MQQSNIRCLKIQEKWVNLILQGTKIWEVRRTNTRVRERIALGNMKTKRVVGYAKIVDTIEMTVEDLKKCNDKHHANDFVDKYANGRETFSLGFWKTLKLSQYLSDYHTLLVHGAE